MSETQANPGLCNAARGDLAARLGAVLDRYLNLISYRQSDLTGELADAAAAFFLAQPAPPVSAGLTRQQFAALSFVKQYISTKGYAPSLAEISAALGLKSRSSAHRLVHGLQERGLIACRANRPRSVALI